MILSSNSTRVFMDARNLCSNSSISLAMGALISSSRNDMKRNNTQFKAIVNDGEVLSFFLNAVSELNHSAIDYAHGTTVFRSMNVVGNYWDDVFFAIIVLTVAFVIGRVLRMVIGR